MAASDGRVVYRLGLSPDRAPLSNLGSSFGTASAGTILVSNLVSGNGTYIAAMIGLAVVALAGPAIATRLPSSPFHAADTDVAPSTAAAALDTTA